MGSGGSGAQTKLSAKGTQSKQITTLRESSSNGLSGRDVLKPINTMVGIGTGNAPKLLSSGLSKMGVTGAIIGAGLAIADKVINFGIDIWESNTGESMIAKNTRMEVNTVMTMGMNVLSGSIKNQLITHNVIRRQNNMLEYGRELYNLNIDGQKNKIR